MAILNARSTGFTPDFGTGSKKPVLERQDVVSCCSRLTHQRRRATNAHTPSTTPNGQVPASQPYREEAAQASAKISTHQAERCSSAYESNMMITAHVPKIVSKLIFHLSSVMYPDDTMWFHFTNGTKRLLSGII